MRWKEGRRSENVEDRRGMSPGGMAATGGLGALILGLIAYFLSGNPEALRQAMQQQQQAPQVGGADRPVDPREEELADFSRVVLGDTEDVWKQQLPRQVRGANYQDPTLVLFSGQVESACGFASAAMGPFYCPADQKVYLDLSFFDDLRQRHHAPGEFAQAYVIAHEVGHHVQNLLGFSEEIHQAQQQVSKEEGNRLSVRLELQADFLAGVWAHHAQRARQILERGDVETAIKAASEIGDDRLQKQAQGYVVPESFTHGTSAQRVKWFTRGLESGQIADSEILFDMSVEP